MSPDGSGSDYSSWAGRHYHWQSMASFLAAEGWQEGVHTIGGDALPLDIALLNADLLTENVRVLPVFFSGAVTAREEKRPPFFSGQGIAGTLRTPALCIADPSIAMAPDLALAWYAGNHLQATQQRLHALLRGVGERLGVELLLIGGSGGGFAALQAGLRLGKAASVLVWNPQTDLLGYSRSAVDHYLKTCWPSHAAAEGDGNGSSYLLSQGIEHDIVPAFRQGLRPRRVVYLQNMGDILHSHRHAGALLPVLDTRRIGRNGFLASDASTLIWMAAWNGGHEPIPKPLLTQLLALLLDPSADVEKVMQVLEPSGGPEQPKALSFAHDAAIAVIETSAKQHGDEIVVRARLTGTQENSVEPLLAFYLTRGEQRLQSRWYQKANEVRFSTDSSECGTHVITFALDSFGVKRSAKVRIEEAEEIAKATGQRVFIYGSCVTRDAFEPIPSGFDLSGYVARSSVLSAMDERAVPSLISEALEKIESRFQRQMVFNDLTGSLGHLLATKTFDVLLWDLIDERFDVIWVNDRPVTVSPELIRGVGDIDRTSRLEMSHPARMALWRSAVKKFLREVAPTRVVLNKAFWAMEDEAGQPLPDQTTASRANRTLAEMYRYIEENFDVTPIDYPKHLLRADPNHRWGVAPFHFVPGFYEHTLAELGRILNGVRNG